MSSLNKATLIGRLGADPVLRNTQSGTPVANFNIATNEEWTDGNNQKQTSTEWHRIVAWNKLGSVCAQHLKKGRQVYVEGRLKSRSYIGNDQKEHWVTEVIANKVIFLGDNPMNAYNQGAIDAVNGTVKVVAPAPTGAVQEQLFVKTVGV